MTEPIPGPRALPLVGNLLDVWEDRDMPLRAIERMADVYGPIYQIDMKGQRRIICSSADLVEELTNEKRFVKIPPASIADSPGPKGLFAARNEDPDWEQGHRILMPSFAPLSVQDMFTDMKDIASQMILSWARKGPEHRILATEDFTRLTLDTIALCTMGYRFNSFYQDAMHPFVEAMNTVFEYNTAKGSRPEFVQKLMWRKNAEFEQARKVLRDTGRAIIQGRRDNPVDKKDVLNTMIYGKDPKTGQNMREELIVEQMTTFLIAGHETTSGLLSFALMYLLLNPGTYLKAQEEVDKVIGQRAIEIKDINKLTYLTAVLRETIRLSPTVPVLQKSVNPALAHEHVLLGGKYKIDPSDQIVALMTKAQRDPKVWGETAEDFDPERMLDENFDRVSTQYPGCWKPFGNGKRACIGRPFAWQESLLVLAMVLQAFDVKFDNPHYVLNIKQALTIKPDDLYIRVSPRRQMDSTQLDRLLHSDGTNGKVQKGSEEGTTANGASSPSKAPMTVLYGSNTGTCQAFAQRLASDATSRGFVAEVRDLDSATNSLPKNTPVVIITSSYEGEPPDNATRFCQWLKESGPGSMDKVQYTVFGCGHRDWSQTFHRIPKLVDGLMTDLGAQKIAPFGSADAAKGDMYGDFEDWLDNSLWKSLSPDSSAEPLSSSMDIEISTNARATNLRYDVSLAIVKANYVLTKEGEPVKCHMDIELPSDAVYQCGDYLAILPQNSEKSVKRVMARFGLPWDAVATLTTMGPSTIPVNTPISVFDILRSYVELSQPATKRILKTFSGYTSSEEDKAFLDKLVDDNNLFELEITKKRTSPLDILFQRSSIKIPFGQFLGFLPPLQVRQYSISSSPLENPNRCSITYGVIDTRSFSDPAHRFEGVTGNYLRNLQDGDMISVSVRPTAKKTFRLPADAEQTPLLMFAAGTGLAPFRGFLQERSIQLLANPNRPLAPALLFLGCRSQTGDRLYAEEVDSWVASGVATVKYAFSKESNASEGCAHVPDRMIHDGDEILKLWRSGARVYVCGTRRFAEGIREAAKKIALDVRKKENGGVGERKDELEKLFQAAMQARVASDVFD
ncbi:hypothetical protein PV10_06195 [Exophiala mesophila]|uniref:Bifunctional cytochrome P450/NADPH--P450 reductase n=1 Tax=Exophiala mesophila TaxID=212818 RepID=A0A0D1XU09_EXOME|nr:uncharacterized protein PV10_06195 [Exophiala mesophila]KIV91681.1 hypothetical protein PV10_06195 [Exophiala mesophila]